MLRGRKAVRADRRLCTDDKAIHAQTPILYKNPAPSLLLTETWISARMFFIRAEIQVGARSAQVRPSHATAFNAVIALPSIAELRCCADEKPSARINNCARMKKPSVRNR
jgi:hypothetical protein